MNAPALEVEAVAGGADPGAAKAAGNCNMRIEPVYLFDLDGTLVDSVYQHVLAWKEALDAESVDISVWRIHRKIGMSGGLFTNQLKRETGTDLGDDRLERPRHLPFSAYARVAAAISHT